MNKILTGPGITIIALLIILGSFGTFVYKKEAKLAEAMEPTTYNMEIFCKTPHGHTVHKFCKDGCCVFTFIRDSDGYPIAVSSTCK